MLATVSAIFCTLAVASSTCDESVGKVLANHADLEVASACQKMADAVEVFTPERRRGFWRHLIPKLPPIHIPNIPIPNIPFIGNLFGGPKGRGGVPCGVYNAACGIVFKNLGTRAISSVVECGVDDVIIAGACELIGLGPEDPFADACAIGLDAVFTGACIAAIQVGGHFLAQGCTAAVGCNQMDMALTAPEAPEASLAAHPNLGHTFSCSMLDTACSAVFGSVGKAITSVGGCTLGSGILATACEVIGLGPEDPFADACAAAVGTVFEIGCVATVLIGGSFGQSACQNEVNKGHFCNKDFGIEDARTCLTAAHDVDLDCEMGGVNLEEGASFLKTMMRRPGKHRGPGRKNGEHQKCGQKEVLRCMMRASDNDSAVFKCMSSCLGVKGKGASKGLKRKCFAKCYRALPECQGCLGLVMGVTE